MSYDLLRVTLEAELDAVTEYRQEEMSDETAVLEVIDWSEFPSRDTLDEQDALSWGSHRCLTFRG